MDLFGRAPRSETGEHFHNYVWAWRSLADYCNLIAPDICRACGDWYVNDGSGLEDANAVALARVLNEQIRTGQTLAYEKLYMRQLQAAPVPCRICVGKGGGDQTPAPTCFMCNGTGLFAVNLFYTDNVEQFVEFLNDCGGFSIC
jgi:hypothetical protein